MTLRGAVKRLASTLMSPFNPWTLFDLSRELLYKDPKLLPAPRNEIESLSRNCTDINEHLMTLYFIVVENQVKRILELGTRGGESTLALLEALKETDGKLQSVDIEPCEEARSRVAKAHLESRWEFVQIDDKQLEWSEPIDLLFIDTSHEYEHTLFELTRFEPYVVPGGFIILHDVSRERGVAKALSDYVRGRADLRSYRFYGNNGLEVIKKTELAPLPKSAD